MFLKNIYFQEKYVNYFGSFQCLDLSEWINKVNSMRSKTSSPHDSDRLFSSVSNAKQNFCAMSEGCF